MDFEKLELQLAYLSERGNYDKMVDEIERFIDHEIIDLPVDDEIRAFIQLGEMLKKVFDDKAN